VADGFSSLLLGSIIPVNNRVFLAAVRSSSRSRSGGSSSSSSSVQVTKTSQTWSSTWRLESRTEVERILAKIGRCW